MIVLIVLGATLLMARAAGLAGVEALDSWPAATRVGLAAMLLLTASAHFNAMRHDLARMVPPAIPHPMEFVFFTGVCEIFGAFGLLVPRVRIAAALALIVLFVAVLPANVHAARAGLTLGGKPVTPLAVRVPMQILFIALTAWAGIYASR
ncbi:MAG TPA: DoxX family protein [Vicinamibacteria bacterium]|nr:DoxX family protein [Vicinamibacteria bacterium]